MSRRRLGATLAALVSLLGAERGALAEPFDDLSDRRGDVAVVRAPAQPDWFQTEARRAHFGRPLPDPRPQPLTPPIRDILGVSYYTDPDHSVADPVLKKQNQTALRPLHAYVARAVALADGWAGSLPARPRYAHDLVDLLAGWARGGALLGAVNQQGRYERVWTLSGLAIAYLRVRDAPALDSESCRTIELWLARVAGAVTESFKDQGPDSRVNNHACWAALAVLAAGLAAHDQRLVDWGTATGGDAIQQIRTDGFLPLELRRKSLALHYHLFALAPLVMLSELSTAPGFPIAAGTEGAISALTNRVIEGLRDPHGFAAAAGAPQTIALPPRGADLAWAEIVYAHTRDPRLKRWIAAGRPLRDDRLGGDLTAAFGVAKLR